MERSWIVVLCLGMGLMVAACSSDTGTQPGETSLSLSTTPSPATPSESASESGSGTGERIVTAKVQGLGTVLANEEGLTLYLFTNDKGTRSTCTGSCATTWPAFTSKGSPTVGAGVDDGKIGTGAEQQVTYDGHPLYLYSGDSKAGEATGQGIGGIWFAVTPDGTPAGQVDDSGG